MLKNIKSEVKRQLKKENANTASLKRDITIKLSGLDEQAKTLFRGYIQGKCDEKMYNELKSEIAANVGIFLKSPKLLLALRGRGDHCKGQLFA